MTVDEAIEMIKLTSNYNGKDKVFVDVERVLQIVRMIDSVPLKEEKSNKIKFEEINLMKEFEKMYTVKSDPIVYEKAPWWMNPNVPPIQITCST